MDWSQTQQITGGKTEISNQANWDRKLLERYDYVDQG